MVSASGGGGGRVGGSGRAGGRVDDEAAARACLQVTGTRRATAASVGTSIASVPSHTRAAEGRRARRARKREGRKKGVSSVYVFSSHFFFGQRHSISARTPQPFSLSRTHE